MRILIVNTVPFIGTGSGTFTLSVAKTLVSQKHEVCVLLPYHRRYHPEAQFPFHLRTIVFSNGSNQNESPDVNFNFPVFTTHPHTAITFGDLSVAQRVEYESVWGCALQEAIAEFQPDVIHAQHVWITAFCASFTSIPYVISVHGTDLMGYDSFPEFRNWAERAVKHTSRLIAISDYINTDTQRVYGVAPHEVKTVLNGFDDSTFRIIPNISKDSVLKGLGIDTICTASTPVIVFAGKFTAFKGIDVLLHAAALYTKTFPGAITLLLGGGSLMNELTQLKEELSLPNCYFCGNQPQDQLVPFYYITVCTFSFYMILS